MDYAVINPIVEKKRTQLNDMNKKKEEIVKNLEEIKSMKVEFADLIKEREKKAWNDHVTSLIPWFGIEIPITRSSLRLERRVRKENGLSGF